MQDFLVDTYGRKISSLRVSLTNRCNLRCIYCHNEGENNSGKEITVDEVAQIARIAARHGVDKIKFSGGEPLLRTDFEDILRALPDLRDVSVTTNGTLLAPRAQSLKDSGLDRVNVSLDSLSPDRFDFITKCPAGYIERVLDGISVALDVGLTPVKINMVYLKDVNEDEVEKMIDFIRGKPLVLQVIELMNFKGAFSYHADVAALEQKIKAKADKFVCREMHRRTKYYLDGAEVEIVRPIDNSEFCMNCNRLRVTSDCKLKPCLLRNDNLVSVRGMTDEELERALRHTVSIREPFFKSLSSHIPGKGKAKMPE
ncbi:MAG: molybdenum cofactor biosynthesis protein A [Methanocella sp. PtaU1.Bin125]|nr:MAG: molybdenum cofactor biosynthesis protein A [Methanocella sp. PtaU1.Bin125]